MRAKSHFKKILLAILFLFAVILAVFFYVGISDAEYDREFNLYSLLPEETKAVFSTEEYKSFCNDVLQGDFQYKENFKAFNSKLFNLINQHFIPFTLKLGDVDRSKKEVLVSFHSPYGHSDQVFFAKLNMKGFNALQKYLKRNIEESFPYRLFIYRGEEIRIYTLNSGDFLAFYITPRFFVVSFQKKLIEKVIDTYIDNTSLLKNESFCRNCIETVKNKSTLYLNADSISYGNKDTFTKNISDWMAFDIEMNPKSLLLKGEGTVSDSTGLSLVETLVLQEKTSFNKIAKVPKTTCYLLHYSTSNIQSLFDYCSKSTSVDSVDTMECKANTLLLQEFLAQHITDNLTGIQFKDSTEADSCHTILSLPLKKPLMAKQHLIDLYFSSKRKDKEMPPRRLKWVQGGAHTIYSLPINNVLAQFTGDITKEAKYDYAIVYQNNLLIASQMHSLVSYINFIERNDTLAVDMNEMNQLQLNPEYQLGGYMDLKMLLDKPIHYRGFVLPTFVLFYPNFFKDFKLLYQLAIDDKRTSFNLSFLYAKEE